MHPGITLWDIEALKKDVETMPKHNTEFQIIVSDSIEDKASALSLSGSLKASLLGGMVEVGGSAAFFNDTKKSKNQAQVALHYSVTNKFEHLTMSHLGTKNVSYPAVFDQGTATHVVTAVLYGAQAFFVFDREVSSSERVREIEGEMKLMVEKIPKVSGGAKVSGEKGNEAEEKIENFSCTFYGDFALENNPVTYQDAMGVYSTIPKRLGVSGENAVPVRVWLYPLSKLDSRAAQLVREISLVLVSDAQSAMEHLSECDIQCNDMVKDRMATTFPEIQRKIQQFRHLCKQHRQTFQKELARTLPSIRGGRAEEGALMDTLTNKEQLPYSTQRLNEFLDKKQEEMDFVNSYLAELEEVEVVSSRSELQHIVLNHRHNCVVCLALTSLHNEESYLSELNLWLRRQFMKKTHDPELASSACEMPKSKQWFEDEGIRRKARQAVKSFSDFARVSKSHGKIRFIVTSVPGKDNPGASIYLYEEGELISTSFEPPSKPLPPQIDGIRHDRVQLTFNPAAYGRAAISGYRAEYRIVGQENWTAVNVNNTQVTFPVTGLRANTEYQFRYAAVSKPGLSESSDVCDPVKTLPPTCPPGKPVIDTVYSSAVTLTWESPSVIGDGVSIREYKVEYKEEAGGERYGQKDKWQERRTGERTESCTIDGLKPQTPYRFQVSAVCAGGETLISTSREREKLNKSAYFSLNYSPVLSGATGSGLGSRSRLTGESDLRIILVGKRGGGKSATGNTIFGEEKFESILTATPVTQICSEGSRTWNGRKVVVIDTPAIFDTKDSDGQTTQEINRCVTLSSQGPYALVLVTQLVCFTEEDQHAVRRVQEIFGPEAMKWTIVLFTRREDLRSGTLEEYIFHLVNKQLLQLIKQYQGRYCAFNNKATRVERAAQADELMTKIAHMVAGKNKDHLVCKASEKLRKEGEPDKSKKKMGKVEDEMQVAIQKGAEGEKHSFTKAQKLGKKLKLQTEENKRPGSSSRLTGESDLRIILVSKSRGGKSATGNTILGQEKFESILAATPVTQTCSEGSRIWKGRKVVVIDTPAIFDTNFSDEQSTHEICRCVALSSPGPHALVLVTQLGHFTEEDQLAVRRVQEVFGLKVMKYMIVLFTCKEDLQSGILGECIFHPDNEELLQLIQQCQGRYCAFNNKATRVERAAQADKLMTRIADMVERNKDQPFYTNKVYEKAEKLPNIKDMFCVKDEGPHQYERKEADLIKIQKSYEEKQKSKANQNSFSFFGFFS